MGRFLGRHGIFVELKAEGFFVVGNLVEIAVRSVGIELLLKGRVRVRVSVGGGVVGSGLGLGLGRIRVSSTYFANSLLPPGADCLRAVLERVSCNHIGV